MSTVDTDFVPLDSDECGLYDLPTELVSEMCSYLEVHDQLTMQRVCQWWRSNLSTVNFSKYIDLDVSRLPIQSESSLEHALSRHVQKNTQILRLRRMTVLMGNPCGNMAFLYIPDPGVDPTAHNATFGIVARVIQTRHAHLRYLILQDAYVEVEFAGSAYYWLVNPPSRLSDRIMHNLVSVTRNLILENYTIHNALGNVVMNWMDPRMPNMIHERWQCHCGEQLPVVLPRMEWDCSKSVVELYHAFIMGLNAHCPEVDPQLKKQVVRLWNFWLRKNAPDFRWRAIGNLIACFNDGVPRLVHHEGPDNEVNVSAVRQLDPRTFNKLTIHVLIRLYL